jgi:hypothetical protein
LEVDGLIVRGDLGARWGRGSFGAGVEMDSDLVVEAVHEVPVAVHCHRDRAVSETGLDRLGMLAISDQPGGVGVT